MNTHAYIPLFTHIYLSYCYLGNSISFTYYASFMAAFFKI